MATKKDTNPATGGNHITVGAQINDHAAHLVHISAERFFKDPKIFSSLQILITEYYQLDTLSNFWDVYNIEAEAMGQGIIYYPDGLPDIDRTRQLIVQPSDLYRLRPPNPYKAGRLPWIREISKIFLEKTGKLDRVYFTAPFSMAANIRGYENLMTDMFQRPKFVHRLFKFICDDVLLPHIEVTRNELDMPDLLFDGRDAWASPPLITLDMMDEFVVTYTERLNEKANGNLITRGNWGDSKSRDIERFFSQKIKCSPGSLSVLDPDLYNIGPEHVKSFAKKHNLFITAGVDATLLQQGPIDAIVDRIKLYISTFGNDCNCMIHLNQIPGDTPSEHVHAAVAACKTFGQLPVRNNLEDIKFEVPKRESFFEFVENKRLLSDQSN